MQQSPSLGIFTLRLILLAPPEAALAASGATLRWTLDSAAG